MRNRIIRHCKNWSSHIIIIIKNVSYSKSQKKIRESAIPLKFNLIEHLYELILIL